MALQFVFGGSGSGKSTCVYERIIEHSLREEKQNFFVLVPDQFTMQTQMDLVMKHPKGGIMNIDVLSFGRLAYRILEEAGGSRTPVLDDTGKSLVLRKVAAEAEERLPVLGKNLKRLGYIHEIKSALSEFMQYGIGKTELENMLDYSRMRGSLYGKLKDLSVLYEDFQLYLAERFITMEGTFERLARQLEYSAMIADSVVVLDGFTGFTPIQNQIILQLMKRAKEVIVTLTLDREIIHKEDKGGRVQLFSLSLKTKASLEKMAIEAGCRIYPPILVDERQGRFKSSRILAHLEKQLFRVPAEVYREEADGIRLIEAGNMEEEVRQVCRQIRKLLSQGYCYRDIAVISGDVEAYGSLIEEYFEQYELPFFMDKSRKITLNPFIEYIRSALKVLISDYSEKAVFHYLRSGMTQMEKEDADRLENYVLALGIHGRKSWSSLFVRMPEGENGKEELERLNMLREQLVKEFEGFSTRRETVKVLVEQLYSFLTINHSQEKLKVYEKMFAQTGDRSKEKEYAQIYRLVMELLDQLVSLLGEEKMDWEEFAGILDAGFGEIQVGIIPQAIDRILVGDMERTRLGLVKALFFLGMNEGKVPRLSGKGGILSDLDREFLLGSGQELAPTPREQMFIQRFYLYLNLTKPSEHLFLSYCRLNEEGKTMKPSYFVETIKKIYPKLVLEIYDAAKELPATKEEARAFSAALLELYRREEPGKDAEEKLLALLQLLKQEQKEKPWVEDLLDAAFFSYAGDQITRETARLLYGSILYSSVSRLERMASCAYAHFLQYGLGLKERQEYGFEAVDMGNVYHGVLELFAGKLAENNYTWISFPDEEGKRLLHDALDSYAISYGNTILFSSARYAWGMEKMERILWRTVRTLRYHLQAGRFTPREFEVSFSALEDLDAVSIRLDKEERMKLGGRIDRVDTYEEGDRLYVKVMDYKSGNHDFRLAAFYQGLQLQLVVYLNAALELEQKKNPDKEVVPGAFLYYHIADPLVEAGERMSEEEIETQIRKELKVSGVINSNEEVLKGLDQSGESKSQVIPVEYKSDGSLSSRSSVLDQEHIRLLLDYSRKKAAELGRQIMEGEASMNPMKLADTDACTWCSFKNICNFDERLPGFDKRQPKEEEEEEIWLKIREELEEGVRKG